MNTCASTCLVVVDNILHSTNLHTVKKLSEVSVLYYFELKRKAVSREGYSTDKA